MKPCDDQVQSAVEEFQKNLRAAFPGIKIEFVSNADEFKKALGKKPTLTKAGLYVHDNGAHQFAVSTGPNEVLFLASFNDTTPADQPSKDNINPVLAALTPHVGILPLDEVGNVPPGIPPCPVRPLCEPTARFVVKSAIGWRETWATRS